MKEKDRVEALEAEIEAESEGKAAEALDRAERIARRIARGADRKANDIRHKAESKLERQITAERERELALVDLEAKRNEASAREKMVSEVFEEAREILKQWRSTSNREEVMKRLIVDAVGSLAGSNFTVEVAAEDMDLLGGERLSKLVSAIADEYDRTVELTAVKATGDVIGGACVHSEDGRSQVDQTFAARLDRLVPDLRRLLHRELYRGDASKNNRRDDDKEQGK